jgi:signal transduction histidine kinase
MRERVRQLDGQLEIRSSARGVTVLVSLPLKMEALGTESAAGASA